MVHAVEKALKDLGDKVSADERAKAESALNDLKSALKSDDKEAIEKKTEALGQASASIAQRAYAASQAGRGSRRRGGRGRRCLGAGGAGAGGRCAVQAGGECGRCGVRGSARQGPSRLLKRAQRGLDTASRTDDRMADHPGAAGARTGAHAHLKRTGYKT